MLFRSWPTFTLTLTWFSVKLKTKDGSQDIFVLNYTTIGVKFPLESSKKVS